MMTSFQLLKRQQQQQQQNNKSSSDHGNHGDNIDRFHRIKFKILRNKFSNHLAFKCYSKRQMVLCYLPLQILAMISTILGFLGTSGVDQSDNNFSRLSLVEGIIGTMILFFISLVR